MDLELEGKVAFVTGSTSGIGEAIVRRLAREGASVVVHGRRAAEADRIVADITAAGGKAKAALGDHQKERRRLDGELQDWETKLKKYNDQLMQVKTNDEYRAMQHEIATVKEKVGGVEEKILMLMEESETGERRVKQEQARLEELRRQGEARKSLVLQEKSQVEAEAAAVTLVADNQGG